MKRSVLDPRVEEIDSDCPIHGLMIEESPAKRVTPPPELPLDPSLTRYIRTKNPIGIPLYDRLLKDLWIHFIIPYLLCGDNFNVIQISEIIRMLPDYKFIWSQIPGVRPGSPWLNSQIMAQRNVRLLAMLAHGSSFSSTIKYYDGSPNYEGLTDDHPYFPHNHDNLIAKIMGCIPGAIRQKNGTFSWGIQYGSFFRGFRDSPFLVGSNHEIRCFAQEDRLIHLFNDQMIIACNGRRSIDVIKRIQAWFYGVLLHTPLIEHPLCTTMFSSFPDPRIISQCNIWARTHDINSLPPKDILSFGDRESVKAHYSIISQRPDRIVLLLANPHPGVITDYLGSDQSIRIDRNQFYDIFNQLTNLVSMKDFYQLLNEDLKNNLTEFLSNTTKLYNQFGFRQPQLLIQLFHIHGRTQLSEKLIWSAISAILYMADGYLPWDWICNSICAPIIIKLIDRIPPSTKYSIKGRYNLAYQYAMIMAPWFQPIEKSRWIFFNDNGVTYSSDSPFLSIRTDGSFEVATKVNGNNHVLVIHDQWPIEVYNIIARVLSQMIMK